MEIIKEVHKLIDGPVKEAGYVIDEITYEKEGSINFLRVIIDKDGLIDVDDCVIVSKVINPLLDE